MFRWLRQWRERRRLRRRGLFEYFDGRRMRFADPYFLFRSIVNNPSIDLETVGPAAEKGEEPATTQLAEFVAATFGIARFDPSSGDGLTDSELFALLERFYDWLEALKKNGNRGPISSPATGSPSSIAPAPPGSIP